MRNKLPVWKSPWWRPFRFSLSNECFIVALLVASSLVAIRNCYHSHVLVMVAANDDNNGPVVSIVPMVHEPSNTTNSKRQHSFPDTFRGPNDSYLQGRSESSQSSTSLVRSAQRQGQTKRRRRRQQMFPATRPLNPILNATTKRYYVRTLYDTIVLSKESKQRSQFVLPFRFVAAAVSAYTQGRTIYYPLIGATVDNLILMVPWDYIYVHRRVESPC